MSSGDDTPILIDAVLRGGLVRSVFQPIVEMASGNVVAYEALARGSEGPLSSPVDLFAAARRAGRLAQLDELCRRAAFAGAVRLGLLAPLTLFVNVEPEILDTAPLDDLLAIPQAASGELRVVIEVTERALTARPAELLRTMDKVREIGWGIALDDVGAEPASLAFMPLLRPDVVKLDLALVQNRPGPEVAEIMNAVNAYAERSGAMVLAEGIETEAHRDFAEALGATLGQGWLFGRPSDRPSPLAVGELIRPAAAFERPGALTSPFDCLPAGVVVRESAKGLLIELSKQLEREALRLGATCVVAATFQEARHFTTATARRYRRLVERAGFVCVLGEGLPPEPLPGLRGAELDPDDVVRGQWDITVLSPHFAAALLAQDLGDSGPDLNRRFSYALTYDRDSVVAATRGLLSRVLPRLSAAGIESPQGTVPQNARVESSQTPPPAAAASTSLLLLALAATSTGAVIVDLDLPDQPVIYANASFEKLSGCSADQIVGRNCRFLQGSDTDPAAIARIRSAVALGQESRERLLNYRGPNRQPWWNDLHLIPAPDDTGRIRHYIGIQTDITAQVNADRALIEEQKRVSEYHQLIEAHAYTDPLTGLPNRRRLEQQAETEIWEIESGQSGALALLFLDLDGFKAVNDALSHAAGDDLLVLTARRLAARLRRSDHLGRLGGDEFLILLPGLDADTAAEHTEAIIAQLQAAVASPTTLHGQPVVPAISIGYSLYPAEAETFTQLIHLADRRMHDRKHPSRT